MACIETENALDFTFQVDQRWFVLHTKSRQEKALCNALQAGGVDYYFPLVGRLRTTGRRKTIVHKPLFSGYVFLKGTWEQVYWADRTRRVAQIIPVVDQKQFCWEIQNVQLALTRQVDLDSYPYYLKKGVKVVVRSGPLRGLEGFVESRLRRNRLILQVQTLGRAASLEIDSALLEPLE